MEQTKKVEWCKKWIEHTFGNLPYQGGGIERNHFFRLAEEAGLYTPGTFGGPMSEALSEMAKIEPVKDADGNFIYHVIKLA